MAVRWVYDKWYRYGEPPWILGPRKELVDLLAAGRLGSGRAIDLGCGVGDNAAHLARHGFEVVGVDFAAGAIERARAKAEPGLKLSFDVADVLTLPASLGPFDLAVDYGTCDDLDDAGRAGFRDTVARLLRPGGLLLTWCFEWEPLLWERVVTSVLPFGKMAMRPGEVEALYRRGFAIDRVASGTGSWPRGWAAYLCRKEVADAA